jgi:hypothetical protein
MKGLGKHGLPATTCGRVCWEFPLELCGDLHCIQGCFESHLCLIFTVGMFAVWSRNKGDISLMLIPTSHPARRLFAEAKRVRPAALLASKLFYATAFRKLFFFFYGIDICMGLFWKFYRRFCKYQMQAAAARLDWTWISLAAAHRSVMFETRHWRRRRPRWSLQLREFPVHFICPRIWHVLRSGVRQPRMPFLPPRYEHCEEEELRFLFRRTYLTAVTGWCPNTSAGGPTIGPYNSTSIHHSRCPKASAGALMIGPSISKHMII